MTSWLRLPGTHVTSKMALWCASKYVKTELLPEMAVFWKKIILAYFLYLTILKILECEENFNKYFEVIKKSLFSMLTSFAMEMTED